MSMARRWCRSELERDVAWGVQIGGVLGKSIARGLMGMHAASSDLCFLQIDSKCSSSGRRIFDWPCHWATLYLATNKNNGLARGP